MIKYVRPVSRSSASGKVARVYEQMKREFGVHAEPIVLHSPAAQIMLGVWALCRENLVAAGRVRRAEKEAVAATVSSINRCPFCVDAHAVMLAASGHERDARRLDRGDLEGVGDPRLRMLVDWAAATRTPGDAILCAPPFGAEEAPELLGTALLFHYINRPVSVFLGESPLPLGGRLLKGGMLALGGRRFRAPARARPEPGASLDLLPPAELPEDLGWARRSPVLGETWARFVAAVERAGETALPGEVRDRVNGWLAEWHGADPGLDLAWLDDALEGLSDGLRPAGRLALLSAIAPYRVDEGIVRAYRRGRGDPDLVAAVAWASLAATRRIGSWLAPAPERARAA